VFIVCEFSEEYSIRIFEIAHFAKLRIRSSRPKVVFSSTETSFFATISSRVGGGTNFTNYSPTISPTV